MRQLISVVLVGTFFATTAIAAPQLYSPLGDRAFALGNIAAGRVGGGYWGGGYYSNYGYNYGYPYNLTGVKFHLNLVEEAERPAVKRGILSVDGSEMGILNQFDGFWNGILKLIPGTHDVVIELEDGRTFQTSVAVQPGQTIRVYPRFPNLPRR